MTKTQIANRINDKVLAPVKLFLGQEKSGGVVLAVSVVLAMVLANSALGASCHDFFQQKFGFVWNGETYFNFTLHHWINDGLMSVFFFLVGLELKREFIAGELSDLRNTVLPIGAAVGGMLTPAMIYLLLNAGTSESVGWGIPMATDIAFALSVVCLLGSRVPSSVKVFLTTLAIVDDLGAVIVIALFYTSEISLVHLLLGLGFLLLMFVGNKLGVKTLFFYALLGIGGVWVCFLLSGVHATIAAVLAAMTAPADSAIDENTFLHRVRKLTKRFDAAETNDVRTLEKEQVEILSRIHKDTTTAIPPLQLAEHYLNPVVTFAVLPVFAFANAGVNLVGIDWTAVFATNVTLGVTLGLLLGKPFGVIGVSWLLCRLGLARIPETMTIRQLLGLGFLASIGFTMSMFVSTLAFQTDMMLTQSKIGVFIASILGGLIGYKLLKSAGKEN